MKNIKLYNLIFPIWLLLFFPPVIFFTLIGNFIIDSLVILACFFLFKISKVKSSLKPFYKKSILKVWLFGFLADIIGASFLILVETGGEWLGVSNKLNMAIAYDPFSHPLAVIIILISMLISSTFIFLFNYKFTFKTIIEEKTLKVKVALAIAIITIPWTFLLPMKLFYKGM